MGRREEVFLLVVVVVVVVVVGTCCWNLLLLELVWVVLGCKPKLCDEAEAEVEVEVVLVCLYVGLGLICWAAQERKKPWAARPRGRKAATQGATRNAQRVHAQNACLRAMFTN